MEVFNKKILYIIIPFVVIFISCKSRDHVIYNYKDINSCYGTVFFHEVDGEFIKWPFSISDTNDIKEFCEILSRSTAISQGPSRKSDYDLTLTMTFHNGSCKEFSFTNYKTNFTRIDISGACTGFKYHQGQYSNTDLNAFFLKILEKQGINIKYAMPI